MTRHESPAAVDRPSCQGATPADCSQCTMSYDCARVRSGRTMSWALVAIVIVAAMTLLSRLAGGA